MQLEDLLDFDCVLLLLHGRNDAARAVYFLKRAGELSQYKHFVGKPGSVFFVTGAEPVDLEDRRKELAYEMMKLGFLTAELPYRIRADNEVYHAGRYGMAGLSLSLSWSQRACMPATLQLSRPVSPWISLCNLSLLG